MHEVILSMSFELERFEWAAGDRLEVAGRWFGVRGQRFLRPTLEVDVDGDTHRLLATLEHKPWAVEEGEEWLAAFEWQGPAAEEIESARLIVGPDSPVELARPGSTNGRRRTGGAGRRELAAARAEVKRLRASFEREREAAVAERAALAAERDAARSELLEARLHVETLESRLRVASRLRDEAREERNAALEVRDAALGERDAALGERDAAVVERDTAVAELEGAVAERHGRAPDLEAALAQRDAALVERDTALAERDAALAGRERARNASGDPSRAPAAPVPAVGASADFRREAVRIPSSPRPAPEPASPEATAAEAAEARFLSYPLRPRARGSEKVLWAARALAILSLLLFVAAVIALIL